MGQRVLLELVTAGRRPGVVLRVLLPNYLQHAPAEVPDRVVQPVDASGSPSGPTKTVKGYAPLVPGVTQWLARSGDEGTGSIEKRSDPTVR